MALTGVVAIALSAWAVWLLKRTLDATRAAVRAADDAVEVTRDLGEAQIRAYLHCKSGEYKLAKDSITAIVELENAGQSPASNVYIKGKASIYEVGGFARMPRVLAWVMSSESTMPCQPIKPNGNIKEGITYFWDYDFPLEEEDDRKFKRRVFDEGNEIAFDLTVKWSDVFGKRHEFPVEFLAVIDASPNNPRKKRSKAGKLEFRVEDARHRIIDSNEDS